MPFTYVDTEESLEQLLEELKESQEFAIDLEVRQRKGEIGRGTNMYM